MKLLWLCNMVPGKIREAISGKGGSGLWVDHVLSDLSGCEDITLRILCPDGAVQSGEVNQRLSYACFKEGLPYHYSREMEQQFVHELEEFNPDVIHIWGTEYGHTLAMVNACKARGLEQRVAVSIQGLCSVYAGHYAEGLPQKIQRGFTLRDLIRWDNIAIQQRKFALRGQLEIQALEQTAHVIGRTPWDAACTRQVNPERIYHFCNETLREAFYSGSWSYESCKKHRIFASSCVYPIKGFHYLLEAFCQVLKQYPDATLAVPGKSFFAGSAKEKFRQNRYEKYMEDFAVSHGLKEKIEFLGRLSAEQMKQAFLDSNVFALPSTIENSPNSLGEAMLLGVPCVAADVGGVSTMLKHNEEGFVYQSTAPYMLAHHICQVFAMEDKAAAMGLAAREHARKTHDPEENLRSLLEIYRTVGSQT